MKSVLSLASRPWFIAAALFVITGALYARTGSFEFVNFDDDSYVTRNPAVLDGLSASSVRWAWTTGHSANWHPLTWLSHMLDVQLFGLDPGAHHRTSALLHAANAALLFAALRALTGASGPSALVAALFALHPLRAESVAWVAERKDVLAALFWFASLWAYARYARGGSRARLALSVGLFALSLLAKPMGVTLPCVLLLLDVWPLGRAVLPGAPAPSLAPTHPGEAGGETASRCFGCGILREKLPFFALAAASAVVTFFVQRAYGSVGPLDVIPLEARAANAFHSYALYAWKTLWPTGLCAFYPHPTLGHPDPVLWTGGVLGSLAFLGLATAAAWWLRRRAPAVLVGWLWFLGMLVPVVGFVQVGLQAWADRYSYLPTIGLWIALVFGARELLAVRGARVALAGLATLALVPLSVASAHQIDTWRSSRTLFEQALSVTEHNFLAHVNLGQALQAAGELEAAGDHFQRAIEERPNIAPVHVNLASVRRMQGRNEEARAALARALQLDPRSANAHDILGGLLAESGADEEALTHMRAAVELAPEEPVYRNDLAWVLATSRSHPAAEEALATAEGLCAATRHGRAEFLESLAAALARLGRYEEAVRWQERALLMVPARDRPAIQARLELYRAGRPYLRPP